MLDELFDLDRDGGRRDANPQVRRGGIRGLFDRLLGAVGDGDEDDDARRRNGDSRYNDTDDEYPHRQEGGRRRRREDRDGLDFGDD